MRRLPVLQAADTDDAEAALRPPWQWALIGTGFTTTIWAPLAIAAAPLGASALVLAFAIAAGLAGGLVGRFGGRAGRREAALGGLGAALGAALLACVAGPALPPLSAFAAFAALGPVGVASGYLGGVFGVRKRPC